ncbi:hypothetical protein LUZ63_003844 [Rhynchospora breviuscula]|uniref:Uncharacterized protein n=1 Tax=Rhynchospora breviuscula TaxID=2022672 RepID=A0A9Q0D1E0_9POAL|nr:hypothetical protein LUZ63_003844 [Rhynchospora breviuscula]
MALRLGLSSFNLVRSAQTRVHTRRSTIHAHTQSPQHERRSANYQPTIWRDNFIQSICIGDQHEGRHIERVRQLKKEASLLIYQDVSLRDKLELLDALQQLGVAYHFTNEIDTVITKIHESMDQVFLPTVHDDLYVVSLLFRLLRMHGFSVQEDIFKKYLDNKGHFKEKLSLDVKGILSLYEASHFGKEGEEILEIARQFTTKHLVSFTENMKCGDSKLQEQVTHALDIPLQWRMERLHTRWFIDQYKKHEQIIPALWELAVLDFNLVQNTYKSELKQVSRWWSSLKLYEKLPFARDRAVENYLWSIGFSFEPDHSCFRMAQAQATSLISTVDDIYDLYGTLNELEAFTDAIEQWDITATEVLPEYMQIYLSALFNTVENQCFEIFRKKGLHVTQYLRRAWKELCKAYLVEARWYHNGYVPTFEEYLENAWVSITGNLVLTYACCMNNNVTGKDLGRFSSGYPDIVRYASMNFRFYNDFGTSSDEQERGDIKKSVQCYMHNKGVTEFIARQEINKMIRKYWTFINGEITGNSSFEKYFKNVVLNVPRTALCFYEHGDGYGKPGLETKDRITSLLFDPIKLN